jgi:hypothetical protein
MRPLFHHVARTEGRARAWSTWDEGVALFQRVLTGCPGAVALVVMPDHLHLVHPHDVHAQLGRILSGHTRSRRARDPRTGCFAPSPRPEVLVDAEKARRSVRYVHLNPCRAHLCADPLGWPLSTHRDAVGLALPPLIRPRTDPERFHAYVSADPTVNVRGTELPGRQVGVASAHDVLDAVSALTRTPLSGMRRRGPARSLYLAAARELTELPAAAIAALVGVREAQVRASEASFESLRVVRRVLGDRRFPGLPDGALR